MPRLARWSESQNVQVIQLVSGMTTALIWSSFFALCPSMFQAIANFGSNATSVAHAEFKALQYFWWFMVLTAFTGPLLAQMVLLGFNDGLRIGDQLSSILRVVALAIPSTISATWLNWIIFRFLIILPLNYLLQINTFLFHYSGMKAVARITIGGGPGGPTPYRIYVDSGVALMCALALAPASPLVAPACFLYFLFCQPILRRNLIFSYRPKYDGGGLRFPFIFDMAISALVVGQLLLTTSMALKQALGPTILSALPIVPTVLFSRNTKNRFLHAYRDAALLQTSLLDGWNTEEETSMKEREEFRRFLVDAHKAAYVPVCIAGAEDTDFLTAEPAVVVPLETEILPEEYPERAESPTPSIPRQVIAFDHEVAMRPRMERRSSQYGATMRRASHALAAVRQRHDSSVASTLSNLLDDPTTPSTAAPHTTTFERSEDMVLPSIFYRDRKSRYDSQQKGE
jgi:Calcium-dependent channel, 7TM region, putative phosphate